MTTGDHLPHYHHEILETVMSIIISASILHVFTGEAQQSGLSDSESSQPEPYAGFPGWPFSLQCLASLPCTQADSLHVSVRMCVYLSPHSEKLWCLRNVPKKVWDAISRSSNTHPYGWKSQAWQCCLQL